jgi:hypothetical protein
MSFNVYDEGGNQVMERWDRTWSGGVEKDITLIYNDYLIVKPAYRGRNPIGAIVNKSQLEFLKKHALENGEIHVNATLEVGAYNWANQGFKFKSEQTLRSYRDSFKSFLSGNGIHLTDNDMLQFTLPCHFAAFHDGRYYDADDRRANAPLNRRQKQFGNLEGKQGGETSLTPEEIRNGKTKRFHLGKAFLLNRGWLGKIEASEANESNEAYNHLQNYSQLKLDSWKAFNPRFKAVVEKVYQGDAEAEGMAITETDRGPPLSPNAKRLMDKWKVPPNRTNLTINTKRVNQMRDWTVSDFEHFIEKTPLTTQSKKLVLEKKKELHG